MRGAGGGEVGCGGVGQFLWRDSGLCWVLLLGAPTHACFWCHGDTHCPPSAPSLPLTHPSRDHSIVTFVHPLPRSPPFSSRSVPQLWSPPGTCGVAAVASLPPRSGDSVTAVGLRLCAAVAAWRWRQGVADGRAREAAARATMVW